MNSGRHISRQTNLLATALHRSFSRSALGLRLTQDVPPNQPEKCWVTASCMALACLGLSLSFFSTRQLCDDPNSRCLLRKK
ncbi:hypothetical protein ACOMHN_063761 [Nucella lapillus]